MPASERGRILGIMTNMYRTNGTTLPTMVSIRSIPIGGTFQYLPRNETFRVIERDDETTTYKSEDVQNPSRIVTCSGWKVWDLTTTTDQKG